MLSFQLTFPKEDADSKIKELSFIFCAVYLLLGMALIAMCFNLMQVCHFYSSLNAMNIKKQNFFILLEIKTTEKQNNMKMHNVENVQSCSLSLILSTFFFLHFLCLFVCGSRFSQLKFNLRLFV